MSERVIRSGGRYAGQHTWVRTVLLSNVLSVLARDYASCMKAFVMNEEERTINMQMYFYPLQIYLYTFSVEEWRKQEQRDQSEV